MSRNTYPPGNSEFLELLERKPFDRESACRILKNIENIDQAILDRDGFSTTYLFEAQSFNNVDAVRFLLENGANPNFNDASLSNDCPLYNLHFLFPEMEDEMWERLKIVSLFFEYGADPNLLVEDETLYDHVIWEVFYHDSAHRDEYLFAFFKRLLAYGGGGGASHSQKPVFTEPIIPSKIDEYQLQFTTLSPFAYLAEHIIRSLRLRSRTFKVRGLIQVLNRAPRTHTVGHLINPDGIDIGIFE